MGYLCTLKIWNNLLLVLYCLLAIMIVSIIIYKIVVYSETFLMHTNNWHF